MIRGRVPGDAARARARGQRCGLVDPVPAAGPPVVLTSCLNRPSSFVLDDKTGAIYVTEAFIGRLVVVE